MNLWGILRGKLWGEYEKRVFLRVFHAQNTRFGTFARASDSVIRVFESLRPSHEKAPPWGGAFFVRAVAKNENTRFNRVVGRGGKRTTKETECEGKSLPTTL